MKLVSFLIVSAFTVPVIAQNSSTARVFSSETITTQLTRMEQQAERSGNSGLILGGYSTHTLLLSVGAKSGGAELHSHYDDVVIVEQGHATLITGGMILKPQTVDDGETVGSGIRNGKSQVVTTGDIIHIPAGTPHQFLIDPGTTFSTFVVKVRE